MIVSAVRDPYPTRDKSEGALIRRTEPVVHGEWTEDSPLSQAQVEQFERDGYLVLTDVFSAHELDELRAAAERVSKNCAQTHAGQLIKEADGDQLHAHQHQQSREYLEISHARSLLPFVSLNIQNTVRGTPVWLETAPKTVDFRVNRGVFFGRVRLPFRHPCGAPEGCFARIASPRTLGPGGDGILAALTG